MKGGYAIICNIELSKEKSGQKKSLHFGLIPSDLLGSFHFLFIPFSANSIFSKEVEGLGTL